MSAYCLPDPPSGRNPQLSTELAGGGQVLTQLAVMRQLRRSLNTGKICVHSLLLASLSCIPLLDSPAPQQTDIHCCQARPGNADINLPEPVTPACTTPALSNCTEILARESILPIAYPYNILIIFSKICVCTIINFGTLGIHNGRYF